MKKTFLYFLCILCFISCNSSKSLSGETTLAGASEEGTLLLNAHGYGVTNSAALENALSNGFKNLLFKGIPGSFQYLPLVGKNPINIEKQHQPFFDDFFATKTYEQFILSKDVGRFRASAQREANISARIKVNVTSLRSYLEQKNIIRKFGL